MTPWTVAHQAVSPWDFPCKNTEVGCHFLLRGIFPTQGSNSCLLYLPVLAGGFFTTSTIWGNFYIAPKCWSWLPGKPTKWTEVWKFQPHRWSPGKGRGWRWSSFINDQRSNQLSLCHKTLIKPPKEGILRVSRMVNVWRFRVRTQKPHTPSHIHCLIFWLVNGNLNRKMFSWILWAALRN